MLNGLYIARKITLDITKSIFKDDRLCSNLIDIDTIDDKFIYQFGNMKVTTKENPIDLFNGYEYIPQNSINLNVKNKLIGMIKRFLNYIKCLVGCNS